MAPSPPIFEAARDIEGFVEGRADAALAASIFHDDIQRLGELKKYLAARGVAVRLNA